MDHEHLKREEILEILRKIKKVRDHLYWVSEWCDDIEEKLFETYEVDRLEL